MLTLLWKQFVYSNSDRRLIKPLDTLRSGFIWCHLLLLSLFLTAILGKWDIREEDLVTLEI